MSFQNLNLSEPIQRALNSEGYTAPTPIQRKAIPILLQHKDLLGCAQTGTGKTAAFALPIIQSLNKNQNIIDKGRPIRALIICPTRELAAQIGQSFTTYSKHTQLRNAVIFGGVQQWPQQAVLKRGVDIVTATPGRLLDLIQQGYINLDHLEWFVLDEADLMLDMGFINDIKKVVAMLPEKRQSAFFSATMPPEAARLAKTILHQPERVDVTEQVSSADTINQMLYFVKKDDKRALLIDVLNNSEASNALVFTRTKYGADKVARNLNRAGIKSEAIHGNKAQNVRIKVLGDFKKQRTRVLVATDIAARGIDVNNLSMVINYELPNVAEMYIHRIGRTGRAGAGGTAVSFCDTVERAYLKDIHKLLDKSIPVATHLHLLSNTKSLSNPIHTMKYGKVKFFNQTKGFGFITENDTEQDYFVHQTGLVDRVKDGDEVSFDVEDGDRGPKAISVKLA